MTFLTFLDELMTMAIAGNTGCATLLSIVISGALIMLVLIFCLFAVIGEALTVLWERRYGRHAKRMRQYRREAKARETEHKNLLKQWAREDRAFNRAMGFK